MAYLADHSAMLPSRRTPNFNETSMREQCTSAWRKAFCCRHINFKTVFQSPSEHTIFINFLKFWEEGQPVTRPHPSERVTPSRTHSPRRLGRLETLGPLSKILNSPLLPAYFRVESLVISVAWLSFFLLGLY